MGQVWGWGGVSGVHVGLGEKMGDVWGWGEQERLRGPVGHMWGWGGCGGCVGLGWGARDICGAGGVSQ